MARCRISNPKKLADIAARVGRPIAGALTRGGTDHRIDALLPDGSVIHLYRDGTQEVSRLRWSVPTAAGNP